MEFRDEQCQGWVLDRGLLSAKNTGILRIERRTIRTVESVTRKIRHGLVMITPRFETEAGKIIKELVRRTREHLVLRGGNRLKLQVTFDEPFVKEAPMIGREKSSRDTGS